jgi:hypothetical protein
MVLQYAAHNNDWHITFLKMNISYKRIIAQKQYLKLTVIY